MIPNTYDIGDGVVLRGEFFDSSGQRIGPNTVILRVLQPDGTSLIVATTIIETGVYEGTFEPTQSGDHGFRFQGTGGATAAEEGRFRVRPQRVHA